MSRGSKSYLDLTKADFIVHGSLDEVTACGHFLGKSLAEAEKLFFKNALYYQEDLMYMGPRAFCIYFEAFVTYLESPAAEGDSDSVNCLVGLLEFRLKYNRREISAAFGRLAQCCRYILKNWSRYEVSQVIYGNLKEQLGAVCASLESV